MRMGSSVRTNGLIWPWGAASRCLAMLLSNYVLSSLLSGSLANQLRSIVWPFSKRFDKLKAIHSISLSLCIVFKPEGFVCGSVYLFAEMHPPLHFTLVQILVTFCLQFCGFLLCLRLLVFYSKSVQSSSSLHFSLLSLFSCSSLAVSSLCRECTSSSR